VSGDSSALVRILEKIEGHLRENGTQFMSGDSVTRADCYVLPSLQHIRVAGKVRCGPALISRSGTEEGGQGPLCGEESFPLINYLLRPPEFLITPLLVGPVCLISQGRF